MQIMPQKAVVEFFEILEADNPHPQTELEFSSPFELLAAVLLSAQATDVSVNKATRPLFAQAPKPEHILAMGLESLTQALRSIGLYRNKAQHLFETCKILIEQHQGQVPRSRQALEALPGVGRKTANVILNVAFHEATMAVDTHIFRVSNRTALAPGATPLAVEQGLLKQVPAKFLVYAHHWLILHGRYVCKARSPLCTACKVRHLCALQAVGSGMPDGSDARLT